MGHESTSMNDVSWVLQENLQVDFAYHTNNALALAARQIINAFYGPIPHYSYLTGYLVGGRDVLIEAPRYPDYFNGIVASDHDAILSSLY